MQKFDLDHVAKFLDDKYARAPKVKLVLGCKIATTLHCKHLLKECKSYNIDPKALPLALRLKDKAALLLYSYYKVILEDPRSVGLTVQDLCSREKVVFTGLEESLLKLLQIKETPLQELKTEAELPSQALPISLVLVICYLSSFIASFENRPVLPGEFLGWVSSFRLKYLTAHASLEIPDNYRSLYKPIHVPSAGWLLEEAQKLLPDHSFLLNSPRYKHALLHRVAGSLSLNAAIPLIALKLVRYAYPATKWKDLDLILLSCLVIALKLEYGLNDTPYGQVSVNSSSAVNPSHLHTQIAWSVGELQFCTAPLEAASKLTGVELDLRKVNRPFSGLLTVHTEAEEYPLSALVLEEAAHSKIEGAELPAPTDDFILYPPKHTRRYHAEYIIAVYRIAATLAYSVKSLNECVYKISRAFLAQSLD